MNLDQMLVIQFENQDAIVLLRALFLSHICFGSICIVLVYWQGQTYSFCYPAADADS